MFSAAFALLGGQSLIERWVLSLNMSPVQFMLLSQAIIFLLGWPLEWTEIIVIFVPIFLPLPKHFNIDPILRGTLDEPYMLIVILCMVIMYLWPGMSLRLPNYLYGGG